MVIVRVTNSKGVAKMIRTFEDAERVLAETLPGYSPRPQQQRLASSVEDLFSSDDPRQLLGQAGCGVGKSLAVVIASILSKTIDENTGRLRPRRVVVATATKALQEQYADKDLPLLKANLPVDFTWALLKGRSNYICQAKLAEVTTLELRNVERVRQELKDPEHSGDFEHLSNRVVDDQKHLLSMSSAECPGKKQCPFGEVCFAEKAKEIAKDSQIVITNTAMLMTEARIRQLTDNAVEMLGHFDAVVIDEAHELPEIAANAQSDQLRRRGVESLITSISSFIGMHEGEDISELYQSLTGAVEKIWEHLDELSEGAQVAFTITEMLAHVEPYIELIEGLRLAEVKIARTQLRNGDAMNETAKQSRIQRRILSMIAKLTEFLTSQDSMVRWVESETNRRKEIQTVLKWSPVEVGPFLRKFFWDVVPVAMVSATLSVGSDFSYISKTLGLTDSQTLDVGTPFDYTAQARLFVPPATAPHPSKEKSAWISYAQSTTLDLVRKAGGGALLLYTSKDAMKNAHAMLSGMLEMAGYTVLMQGLSGTNKEIAKTFADDTHSVLFAMKSFFTGVDFSGETCRLVIIDKLPFPVPSEIMFKARADLMNRTAGRDISFNALSIPMMTLTLVQAFGRLIRSHSDRGVVAILDPRLVGTGWGKGILRNLPQAPVTHDVNEVVDFYGTVGSLTAA